MSMTVTNNDTTGLVMWEPIFQDELITFAGAGTLLAGTILARKTVADAVVSDGTGNTGDGTLTLSTVAAGTVVPVVGAYNLECVAAVTHGGTFKLVDPNGAQVASDLVMTAGAGVATAFEVAGLAFTVTDGATDFIVGDAFSLTVAADGKIVPFAIAGAGGAQVPLALLLNALTATGAGDLPARPLVKGTVRSSKLVIDADGDASNVTAAILDQLRDYGIVALSSTQLANQDNQ